MIVRLPGIYPPQHDTALLISALRGSGLAPGRHVLDICTGTGAVAVAAAALGAASVTAVDLSRRAVISARANSLLQRVEVEVRRGDLFSPIAGEQYDLVLCNPPYVPAPTERLPRHTRGRSWDAGPDGRALVDRICREVFEVLRPGGVLLMSHTAVIDADLSLNLLSTQGFDAQVVLSRRVPFGPLMNERSDLLVAMGMIPLGERSEELVVIAATVSSTARTAALLPAEQGTASTVRFAG